MSRVTFAKDQIREDARPSLGSLQAPRMTANDSVWESCVHSGLTHQEEWIVNEMLGGVGDKESQTAVGAVNLDDNARTGNFPWNVQMM